MRARSPRPALIALALVPAPAFPATAFAADQAIGKISVRGRRISQTDLAIGVGQASDTVAVTREKLLSAPHGISGVKMLESLPDFNAQTDGALGLHEFGNSVQVRAFDLRQIGSVLKGIPMGRSDAFGGRPVFCLGNADRFDPAPAFRVCSHQGAVSQA